MYLLWQEVKGQKKSKRFFQAGVSSKKRTNKFYFTTMKPQVDLFSFIFWRKLKTPKRHFEINWPLSWAIKDLWGTKVMYCYVLKLLFLIPQSYFPHQAATSIYSEVLGSCPYLFQNSIVMSRLQRGDKIQVQTKSEFNFIAIIFLFTVYMKIGTFFLHYLYRCTLQQVVTLVVK